MIPSAPLRVIPPLTISDSMLVDTDVPESSYAAWNAGTTYAQGARVHLVSTHKVYESVAGGNINNNPATASTAWTEVGPTNRWALLDKSNSTQTAQADSLYYELTPTASFNSLLLLNLTGALSARIRVTHPTLVGPFDDDALYDRTLSLASLPAQAGWWEWTYGERRGPALAVLRDLPGVLGSSVRVDLVGTTELAIGVLLLGQGKELGLGVQHGARIGIQDFSRKERNGFGDAVLVERAFAKRAQFTVPIDAGRVDETARFLSSIRATPCAFVGSSSYESTVIYGFYQEFEVDIAYPTHSVCSLNVEGLT